MNYLDFEQNEFPLAYLIPFRCYGTWLHGDVRGSVYRRQHNRFGTPFVTPSQSLEQSDAAQMRQPPFRLKVAERVIVEQAIREVCGHRGYQLLALNARTNHVHTVVSATVPPEPILNAFKAYATPRLREAGTLMPGVTPWSRHGSTRYLWKPQHVEAAIDYVLNRQDD